jgi:putative ABC transport system permease protein
MLGMALVIGTMSGLVAQQARQIALIKAVGGRTIQVIGIYLGMVLILGILSALLALPFSALGARLLVEFVSGMLNFSASVDRLPRQVVILEIALAVLVPVLAALPPVWDSARRSPALALSEYGHGHVWGGVRWVDRLLGSLRGLGRLERLALRNPFRNRNRLLISIVMLSLAGGTFITVLNLQDSLRATVDSMLSFWQYDFWVAMNKPYRVERLQAEALSVRGVTEVEGWGFELTRRVRPDGSEGNPIFLFGAPVDSPMIDPNILDGRWLLPGDEDAIVIGMGLLDVEPDLGIGSQIVLKVKGQEQHFHIVGIMEMIGNETVGYITYIPIDTFDSMAHQVNHANMAVIRTTATSPQQRKELASAVERAYEDQGLQVTSIFQMDDERLEIDSAFDVLVDLLMVMVLLLAFVGGLGLMSTMSLNVLERSREIGVIRAFGGSNRSVFRVVVLEGVAVGVMSWLGSVLLAIPLTWLFCRFIGLSFLSMPLDFRYSAAAAFMWLGLVIILSAISSSLPAANATRLTVREVLSYE